MILMIAAAVAAMQEPPLLSGPPSAEQFQWARRALNAQMIDYPSARFRDVHADRRKLCGDVIGKTRRGGYAGWQRFVVMGVEGSPADLEGSEDFDGMVALLCDGPEAPPRTRDYSDRLKGG